MEIGAELTEYSTKNSLQIYQNNCDPVHRAVISMPRPLRHGHKFHLNMLKQRCYPVHGSHFTEKIRNHDNYCDIISHHFIQI